MLLALALATRRRPRFRDKLKPLAVIGATTVAAQQMGLTLAAPRIGTSMAAILVATIPLFSMLISHAWGLERINAQGLLGVVLGRGRDRAARRVPGRADHRHVPVRVRGVADRLRGGGVREQLRPACTCTACRRGR